MSSARTISIFGATGSVGTSTLDLVRSNRDAYRVEVLTAHRDVDQLAALAKEFGAELAVVADESKLGDLQSALAGSQVEVAAGEGALVSAADREVDWTMAAIVGCAGLAPTMAALKRGKCVGLANKESLVSAGALMTDVAGKSGAHLLPVDSEHNAIFQSLAGSSIDDVRKITLTASGGPFRGRTRDELQSVTPEQAVAHPNWDMGAKISVDSATMMNKGLELIEAHYLFPVGLDNIEILVHPQSVIHSMVEYHDRSTIAQLGSPDMRIPIASALAWPQRMETDCAPLDLATIGQLDFMAPDEETFPATAMARAAISAGGARPAMLNAANEIAVAAFLDRKIGFLDITRVVDEVQQSLDCAAPASIEDVLAIDSEARKAATARTDLIAA
ncbi:1-deoxy-D-xylulose-5-phosphate reductoisomerase [Alterisphingorhabdus coralli]|uniref:1-deoxy-D-xylulose 5-phosphate reductoisomerase n=1 Tax=Alterisphingorhabdus coralli TaxID=3071408 RepID=A0AA97F6G2_9SPHN|nr:1-deoxy-D-xylulose-5-phosphate reductoisomerase [Parasphingorhabdus sp. SCSIO 66989]WOE74331.1 1-deoxy-D-xylulose-5-phosphate reductoisomerase [Parasphingorhabdus sp. SCSIO 66989]